MAVVTHGRLKITADPAWGWCAGYRHPPVAEYRAGFFTMAQLDALLADPALSVEEIDEVEEVRGPAPGDLIPDVAGGANGGEGASLAATNPEAEVAASNSDQANGEDAPAQEADQPAAASASSEGVAPVVAPVPAPARASRRARRNR